MLWYKSFALKCCELGVVLCLMIVAGCTADHPDDAQVVAERASGDGTHAVGAPTLDAPANTNVNPREADQDDDDEIEEDRSTNQASTDDSQSNESSAIALEIHPTVSEIAPYEPLLLVCSLTNRTDTRQRFDSDPLDVLVSFENGPYQACTGPRNEVRCGYSSINPKQLIFIDRIIFFRDHVKRANRFVFARSGEYRLKARMPRAASDAVAIRVRNPDPKEADATRSLTDTALAMQFQYPSWAHVNMLDDFITKYPKSSFADHARYAFGRSFARQVDEAPSTWSGSLQAQARESTIRALSGISDRIPALRARGLFLMARQFRRNHGEPQAYFELCKELDAIDQNAMYLNDYEFESVRFDIRALRLSYFPDARLDDQLVTDRDEPSSIGDLLDSISRQSRVRLDASPRFKARQAPVPRLVRLVPLREMMQRAAWFFGYWKQDGDGYYLVESPSPWLDESLPGMPASAVKATPDVEQAIDETFPQ